MPPNLPEDPSLKWMLGTMIVVLGGLLAYVVKALVDKITPTLDRLTSAVERIPTAVAEALRDHERTKDHVER